MAKIKAERAFNLVVRDQGKVPKRSVKAERGSVNSARVKGEVSR